MDDRLESIINDKIDDAIHKLDEIVKITEILKDIVDDEEQISFGIALGRIYNAFHYQTRRVLKRNATDEEFTEFVEILSKRTAEIKIALRELTDRKIEMQKNLSEKMKVSGILDVITKEISSKRIVDTQTYISETRARVWKALKRGLQFEASLEASELFLQKHVNTRRRFVVLIADLVGSTRMTNTLPVERLATIIQTFSQEMFFTVSNFEGHVLKYVGDAVIAYFSADTNFYMVADRAFSCARSMITILEQGINVVLNQYDYPELKVKIGIDSGIHSVIRYGLGEKSHVDILGYPISMASKINTIARANQIVISESVYQGIHPSSRNRFSEAHLGSNWNYIDENTGEIYCLYTYEG